MRERQQVKTRQAEEQFEQFFGKELAEELQARPDLLAGRQADVTLLFCDVRGYSRVSARLGPVETVAWINDVMTELSDCVRRHEGVVVDYMGDEMFAMWGAPKPQSDQAVRAVRAALEMRQVLEELRARWNQRLGEVMDVGIGINSGSASVGNTGSRSKFKYGPLGNSVNVASRVQGATKYLHCPLLATAQTRDLLGDQLVLRPAQAEGSGFIARRVVRTRLVNIPEPIDLYELAPASGPDAANFFIASEIALGALESGDFEDAICLAGELIRKYPGDGPLRLILARAAAVLAGGTFDPVWEPPGK
jgi:adenylate cyclase